MRTDDLLHLKYPVGKFVDPVNIQPEQLDNFISDIEILPGQIEEEFAVIRKNSFIEKPYRTDGWTARQVVHHLADSHMNALIRYKLTLTEELPTIKPYLEARWAELPDTMQVDPKVSIELLKGIHAKLVTLMRSSSQKDLDRVYFHPESMKEFKLSTVIALYAWHGKHHLGHLRIINSNSITR